MFYTSSLASNTWVRVLSFFLLIMTICKKSEPHPALSNDINLITRSTPRRLGKYNRWITDPELDAVNIMVSILCFSLRCVKIWTGLL